MSTASRLLRFGFLVLAFLFDALPVAAQAATPWHWQLDGNLFAGLNYQYRKFTDFHALESQNWIMAGGQRAAAGGEFALTSMLSFEPFTLKKLGSPQVFQTGETYQGAPLVDYQHPHDLISGLGVSYDRTMSSYRWAVGAYAVGSPALGPEAFMHRPSAAENPQAPLSHHNLDSTHITPGVLNLGIFRNGIGVETSWFHGREPDENRTDLDLGRLDSWSMRGTWNHGGWSAQTSGGHLKSPERNEPGRNLARLTASVAHKTGGPIATTVLAAWGQNRGVHGLLDAYLFESSISWLDGNYLYSRAELVTKDILNAGGHDPAGFVDFHQLSRVGAYTLGYTHDLNKGMRTRLGLGGDVTMYYVPKNLKDNYGGPVSIHIFLRFRFTSADMMEGMHH
jgi:hypothetical protein